MSSSEYGLPGDVANRWRFLREFLQLATAVLHVQRRRRCCCCCSVVVVEGRKEVASAKTSRTKNPFFGVRGGDDWRPSPRPCHVVRLLLRSRPHPSSRTFPGAAGPGACGAERNALADSTSIEALTHKDILGMNTRTSATRDDVESVWFRSSSVFAGADAPPGVILSWFVVSGCFRACDHCSEARQKASP